MNNNYFKNSWDIDNRDSAAVNLVTERILFGVFASCLLMLSACTTVGESQTKPRPSMTNAELIQIQIDNLGEDATDLPQQQASLRQLIAEIQERPDDCLKNECDVVLKLTRETPPSTCAKIRRDIDWLEKTQDGKLLEFKVEKASTYRLDGVDKKDFPKHVLGTACNTNSEAIHMPGGFASKRQVDGPSDTPLPCLDNHTYHAKITTIRDKKWIVTHSHVVDITELANKTCQEDSK